MEIMPGPTYEEARTMLRDAWIDFMIDMRAAVIALRAALGTVDAVNEGDAILRRWETEREKKHETAIKP